MGKEEIHKIASKGDPKNNRQEGLKKITEKSNLENVVEKVDPIVT